MNKKFYKMNYRTYSPARALTIAFVFAMAFCNVVMAQSSTLTVRFANPTFACDNSEYCLDVEFRSDNPGDELFGINVRFFYDDAYMEVIGMSDFQGGYGVAPNTFNPGVVNTSLPGFGTTFFGYPPPGVLDYVNCAAQLLNGNDPIPLDDVEWTKLFQICFTIDGAIDDSTNFCPPIVWNLEQDPANGGYLGGDNGVVMTIVQPPPSMSGPAFEQVEQFNWQYTGDGSAPPYGEPIETDCISLFCMPTITCAPDITIDCSESTDPANTGMASATDVCITDITVSFDDTTIEQTCDNNYSFSRRWIATNECSFADTCYQLITVIDTTGPLLTCPPFITISCDDSTDPADTGMATATDLCDPNPEVTYIDIPKDGPCPQSYVIDRIWIGTDNCGNNSIFCRQEITLLDTSPPDITCPADLTLECDEIIPTDMATATDNCSPTNTVTISYEDIVCDNPIMGFTEEYAFDNWTIINPFGGDVIPMGDMEVMLESPDGDVPCPDGASALFQIVVPSTGQIVFDWHFQSNDVNGPLYDPFGYNLNGTFFQLTDDNGPDMQSGTAAVDVTAGDIFAFEQNSIDCILGIGATTVVEFFACREQMEETCSQLIIRTHTASDECDNSAVCIQTIYITDTTNPVITCPANTTIECTESTDPSNTGMATATDNCDTTVEISYSDITTASGVCVQEYTIDRTWTATDACGNTHTCVQTIVVDDSTAPVLTCPASLTIECDDSTDPLNTGLATATDNCDPAPVVSYTDVTLGGACPQEYTITRTWTATDACGNGTNCVQVITVDDSVPPTITFCPADVTIECDESTDPMNTGLATATDNCDSAPVVSYSDVTLAGACPQEYSITRTWTATDACGNSSTCEQSIIVEDTTIPMIDCAADITIECDESTDPSNTGLTTATDNCDPAPLVTYSDAIADGNCPQEYTITRTWTITDACGNGTNCIQTIVVDDSTAPVFTDCPVDITIECTASTDPADTGFAIATDNCDGAPVVTYSDEIVQGACPQEYTITRTWTAIDECGNETLCGFVDRLLTSEADFSGSETHIDFDDVDIPPTDPPSGATVQLVGDEYADKGITISSLSNGTIWLRRSGFNLNPLTVNSNPNAMVNYDDNLNISTNTIKVSFSSKMNRVGFYLATNESDDVEVIARCMSNGMEIDSQVFTTGLNTQFFGIESAAGFDEIIFEVVIAFFGNMIIDDLRFEGGCCVQTIKVVDTTPPTLVCAADVTIECDESTDPSNTGISTATDNCDTAPVVSYTDVTVAGECPQEYTITRTWTATDACGNGTNCIQTISVEDTTAPEITCPAGLTIECDESIDPMNTGLATATDNCDPAPVVSYSDVTLAGACPQEYTITRTWSATDACGNSSTCEQSIIVEDTTIPMIDCAADITIECDESTDPSNTGITTATDNCDPAPVVTYSDAIADGNCPQEYTITRTWTITDACGNGTNCIQTIVVDDSKAPSFVFCPVDITIECTASTDPADTGIAEATDNCSGTVTVTYSDEIVQGDCPQEYTITRTWTATDECGNETLCGFVDRLLTSEADFSGNENLIDFEIGIPSGSTLPMTGNEYAGVTFTGLGGLDFNNGYCGSFAPTTVMSNYDACNSGPYMGIIIDFHSIQNRAGFTFYSNSGDDLQVTVQCVLNGVVINDDLVTGGAPVFYGVESVHGFDQLILIPETNANGALGVDDLRFEGGCCVQTIKVVDTTPPTLVCAADVTIECDESTDPSNTGISTATDNCDTAPVVSYTDVTTSGGCAQEYTITRTWTATDACGNGTNCTQVISVEDTTAPEITCPDGLRVECDESTDPSNTGMATATDNCDPIPVIGYTDVTFEGTCPQEYVINRTWDATDRCGNSSTCLQVIIIEDTTNPVFTFCPSDVTIECDDSTDPADTGLATATDNCGPAPTVTYSDESVEGACPQEMTVTRTWLATDACGNTSECVQIISVEDNTPPSIVCPEDLTLECDETVPTDLATATDNCSTAITLTYSDVMCNNPVMGFTDIYDFSNWTTIIPPEGGSVTTMNDNEIMMVSPDDITLNCDDAAVQFSIVIPSTGQIVFDWHYETVDIDGPSYDPFGYNLNGTFYQLTDDNGNDLQSGTATVVVTAGDIFAFEQQSSDCAFGSGASTLVEFFACIEEDADICTMLIIRTHTATDECDNTMSCIQTIYIEDSVDPTITFCPTDVTIECDESTDPSNTGMATATDNCASEPTVTYSDEIVQGDCPQEYTITRTWLATDLCGNISCGINGVAFVDRLLTSEADFSGGETFIDFDDLPVNTIFNGNEYAGLGLNFASIGGNMRTWNPFYTSPNAIFNHTDFSDFGPIQITFDSKQNRAGFYLSAVDASGVDVTVTCISNNTIIAVETFTGIPQQFAFYGIESGHGFDQLLFTSNAQQNQPIFGIDDFRFEGGGSCCVQTIKVVDSTPPTITFCPADVTIECDESTDPLNTGLATATDNCDTAPIVSYSDVTIEGQCPQEFTVTRTWSATDICGNVSTCVQIIVVDDSVAPDVTCPADITIDCNDSTDPENTGYASATDNCTIGGEEGLDVEYSDITLEDFCPEVIQRTWTATDDCGNVGTCIQLITRDDTTPPVIICPGDVTVECASDVPDILTGGVTVSDNCGFVTVTHVGDFVSDSFCINQYTISRVYMATDECDNTATCTQTIEVDDQTPPEIACPADITVDCAEDIPTPDIGTVSATDNCEGEVVIAHVSDVTVSFTCDNQFTVIRTYSATDACGNSSTCSHVITVFDDIPPSITCPANVTVDCAEDVPPVDTGAPVVSDNCSTGLITVGWLGDVISNQTCINRFTITRTYQAVDACGNSATCTQIITVDDQIAPVIACPPNITVTFGDDESPNNTGFPTGSDNCGTAPPIFTFEDEIIPGPCDEEYTIIRTWTATDACGNTATCDQEIFVDGDCIVDLALTKVLLHPVDVVGGGHVHFRITVFNEGEVSISSLGITDYIPLGFSLDDPFWTPGMAGMSGQSASITLSIANGGLDANGLNPGEFVTVLIQLVADIDVEPGYYFNCAEILFMLDMNGMDVSDEDIDSTPDDIDTNDLAGEDDFDCAPICVLPNSEITGDGYVCPSELTTYFVTEYNPDFTYVWELNGGGEIVQDNGSDISIQWQEEPGGPFELRVTVILGDGCSMTAFLNIYIQGVDEIACNDHVQISLDENCEAVILSGIILEGENEGNNNYFVVITDQDGNIIPNATLTSEHIGQIFNVSVMNECNGQSCWGTISVEDKIRPIIECTDVTLTCGSSLEPIYEDLQAGTAIETIQPALPVGPNGGTITTATLSPNVPANAIVTDVNITIDLDHTWVGDLTAELISPSGTVVLLVDQLCGSVDNWDFAKFDDEAGISVAAACSPIPPALAGSLIPEGVLATIDGEPAFGEWTLRITDNVGGDGGILNEVTLEVGYLVAEPVAPYTFDACGEVTLSYTEIESGDACEALTLTRIWTATDESGNTSSCTQTITITPLSLDLVEFPSAYEGECGESIFPNNTGWPTIDGNPITDENDLCNIFVGYWDKNLNDCGGGRKIARTWTVLDWCNVEVIEAVQVIKLSDNEGPTLTCPNDMSVGTDFWYCYANVSVPKPVAVDECSEINSYSLTSSNGIVVSFGNNFVINGMEIGTHTATWTVTDECGNSSTCSFQITVVDDVVPVANCDSHTTVSLTNDGPGGITLVPATVFDDGSYDNCGPVTFRARRMDSCIDWDWTTEGACIDDVPGGIPPVNSRDRGTVHRPCVPFACCDVGAGPIMVELEVEDQAGNINYCMIEVTVQDKISPFIECPPDIIVSCDFWFNVEEGTFVDGEGNNDGSLDEDPLSPIFGNMYDAFRYDESIRQNIVINDPGNEDYSQPYNWGVDGWADDNCEVNLSVRVRVIDDCSGDDLPGNAPEGAIKMIERRFSATDGNPGVAPGVCTQRIWVVDFEPFYIADVNCNNQDSRDGVIWPCDVLLTTCPEDLGNTGEPTIFDDACSLIGVTYEDQRFDFVDGACFKILRRWSVIDWCQYDSQTGAGLWNYTQVIKVHDEEGPQFVEPCETVVLCVADEGVSLPDNNQAFLGENDPLSTSCSVHLNLSRVVHETCSDIVKYDVKIYPNNGTEYILIKPTTSAVVDSNNDATLTFDTRQSTIQQIRRDGIPYNSQFCGDYHRILWSVEDGCGNWSHCEYLFRLEDCKQPSPVCINGLSTVVMPIGGEVTVWAKDFNASSFDDCTPSAELLYSFSGDAYQPSYTYTCENVPAFNVELSQQIWVADGGTDDNCNGQIEWSERNKDFCTTTIVITDNSGVCTGDGSVLAGDILTEFEDAVAKVGVSLTSPGHVFPLYVTAENGHFEFNAVPLGDDYTITPERDDDHRNGVSTLDLVRIQKHLLGKEPFTSPYQYIAADANNSESISAIDLVEIRKLILGLYTEFPANESWRFVEKGYDMDEEHPWPFSEIIQLPEFAQDSAMDNDFVGVKIGDVNNTAKANANQILPRSGRRVLNVALDAQEYVEAGDVIDVRLVLPEYVDGFQWTLETQGLTYAGVNSESIKITDSHVGVLNDGIVTMSWNLEGADAQDVSQVVELQFVANTSGNVGSMIRMTSKVTEAEAYTSAGEILDVKLTKTGDAAEFALYQNTPNPWNDQTIIGFDLPEDASVTFTVFDATGKVVKTVKGDFVRGYNTITLNAKDLPSAGVMYYRLESGNYSASKKMVLVK